MTDPYDFFASPSGPPGSAPASPAPTQSGAPGALGEVGRSGAFARPPVSRFGGPVEPGTQWTVPVSTTPPAWAPVRLQRPGLVVAAAVLVFVQAGMTLLGAALMMLSGAVASEMGGDSMERLALPGSGGIFMLIGMIVAIIGGLLVWCGVGVLRGGRGATIVVIVLNAIGLVLGVSDLLGGATVEALPTIVWSSLIIGFLMRPNSRAWWSGR